MIASQIKEKERKCEWIVGAKKEEDNNQRKWETKRNKSSNTGNHCKRSEKNIQEREMLEKFHLNK